MVEPLAKSVLIPAGLTAAASAADAGIHKKILGSGHNTTLKAVSTTFLLVCFVCLKDSTCETSKNVFYFTLKALFVLEIIKF